MSDPLPAADAPSPEPLTEPAFEGFTVWVGSDSSPEQMHDRAAAALRASLEALDLPTEGWTVKAVHPSQPGMFDLWPPGLADASGEAPPDPALTVRQAWDVAYGLLDQPGIIDAEPSFEILQDNADALAFEVEEGEGELDAGGPAGAATASAAEGEPPIFSKALHDWCPRLIDAPGAWQVAPHVPDPDDGLPPGRSRGAGILVGHPDSGYRRHAEILDEPSRLLAARGWDFVGGDGDTEDELGGHGLGTASVLMSTVGGPETGFVTGVAPAALVVPYRVTRPHLFVPAPVLLRSGMSRLGDAIFRAVDEGCHVISISLGWLQLEKVRRAVQYAFERDVIVVSAAGNRVRFVVWPAHYEEVVSCAGCTSKRRRWSGSSRGRRVDVTGPAEDVWKASFEDGAAVVEQSNGTSFAAASVAGTAALWLAHWGRERLLDRYQGEFRLATVFRKLLTESCDPPPEEHDGEFGMGIVNARRLLETPLPTRDELRASLSPLIEAAHVGEPMPIAGLRPLAEAFDDVPRDRLRADLAALLEVPEAELPERLHGVGRELAFHLLTTPALREGLLARRDAPEPLATAADDEMAGILPPLHGSVAELPLSARLRNRLGLT